MSQEITQAESYLSGWFETINKDGVIGNGVSIEETGVLNITGDATVDDISKTLNLFSSTEMKSTALAAISRLAIADCLIAAEALTGETIEQLADSMNICAECNRSMESIYKWVRTAREIPHELRDRRLSMNQMLCVASVKKPTDIAVRGEYQEALASVLKKGAENPTTYGGRMMSKDLRAIAGGLGATAPTTSTAEKLIDVLHRLAAYGYALTAVDIDPEYFGLGGVKREDIINQIEADRAILIDRGDMAADPRDSAFFSPLGKEKKPEKKAEPIEVESEEVE